MRTEEAQHAQASPWRWDWCRLCRPGCDARPSIWCASCACASLRLGSRATGTFTPKAFALAKSEGSCPYCRVCCIPMKPFASAVASAARSGNCKDMGHLYILITCPSNSPLSLVCKHPSHRLCSFNTAFLYLAVCRAAEAIALTDNTVIAQSSSSCAGLA